ncbi:MAG: hypothetical protein WBF77_11455 [Sulfurimonadaceae bacterium]
MKEQVDLEFCFKGNRTYIQGPDIFDAVVAAISNEFNIITNIKYSAHAMLHKNATMYITEKVVKADYPVINSLINFIGDGIKYYAVVCENDKPIECSTDYSEEIVENNAKITDNTITFKNVLPDSYTEIVVSMNKYFLNQSVKEKGKWIVTKFDYFELADIINIKNKEIKLELLQNFNNKLTKSLLFLDEKPVGHLYFSLIPKES